MTDPDATPVAAAPPPALDRQVLLDLQEALDDPTGEFLLGLSAVYERQAAELVAEMRDAARAADLAGLGRAAHSLKGSSANVGGTRLAAMCAELERWDGPTADLAARVAAIQAEVQALQGEIKDFLAA